MIECSLLNQLIDALKQLPGVGGKTALRLAMHLLERDRTGGLKLASTMQDTLSHIQHCQQCRNYTDQSPCRICANNNRQHTLCVVEGPLDVIAMEQTGHFKGHYFVLRGHLSPLDGIGPEDLGLEQLLKHVANDGIQEVILATGATVEGEATAFYIAERLHDLNCRCTRLALGMPIGGELEYLDRGTLAHALSARSVLSVEPES